MKLIFSLIVDVVKTLFLTVVFFLIKIGDAVTWVVLLIVSLMKLPFKPFKKLKLPKFSRPQINIAHAKTKKKRSYVRKQVVYKPSILYKLKFFSFGVLVSFLFLFIPLLFFVFLQELPNPSKLSVSEIPKTTKIYDRNGKLLYEIFANQNRTIVSLDEVPKDLKNATIAIEDRDFYDHPGFDLRGIARAFLSNVRTDQLQGGSTITQQLIKSSLLSSETTIMRKTKEVVLAFWAERVYSKDEILGMYFNYVPYGGTAWGVESASEVYFGKEVSKLNLAESAFLAGLPRAPSIYSPYAGQDGAWKKRQKDVLSAMVRNGYITQKKADEAYKQELKFKGSNVPIKAPHFVMYVKEQLEEKYGISAVERGGLTVKTSLDLTTQEMAEDVVREEVEKNAYLNISNGASVITDPKNGDILAMVGSRNYFDTEIDGNQNVTTSSRQPGSTIKVVTYALALNSGKFTEASVIDDSPLVIRAEGAQPYIPVNYDGAFHGRTPFRIALANSYNIPAVKLAQNLGVNEIVTMGQQMGIESWSQNNDYGLSITLGGANVTMLDMATVYGTLANNGERIDLDPILEVKDYEGKTVYKKNPIPVEVLNDGVAYIMSQILSDGNARARAFGTNSILNIPNAKVAVKTGTTDNKRDNWTIGYTPDLVVATWVGNNDNTVMSPYLTSGVTGAAPMWAKIMTEMTKKYPARGFEESAAVVGRNCFGYQAYFIRGTESSQCRASNTTVNPSIFPQL